ncbi:MAG TPA: CoA transferase [Thermoanaerobaculia bacterium]|nr:CoA transferase [Thermoanaerobaculia bacterium]
MKTHQPPLPLQGIVVADFSRILAGPLCTMMLADEGARVIKVEEPVRGDETRRWGPPFIGTESSYFLSVNRSKESITLNLKSEDGRRVARKLIERADVVVENFRRKQKEEFGLTPDAVRQINPRAVLCSINGFDSDSAEADLAGYDLLAQAAGGLMSITGERDGDPMKVGVALSDVLTAHYAHGTICAALVGRERGGAAVPVEVSLFGSTVASLINVAQNYLATGVNPRRYGNEHPSIVPYQPFRASDRMFVLAVASDRHFELLCREILQRPDLADDPRFQTNAARVRNRDPLLREMELILVTRSADEWLRLCALRGIPAARVQQLDEVFAGSDWMVETITDPSIGALRILRAPWKIGGRRSSAVSPAPQVGQHTDTILQELGYSAEEVSDLRQKKVT